MPKSYCLFVLVDFGFYCSKIHLAHLCVCVCVCVYVCRFHIKLKLHVFISNYIMFITDTCHNQHNNYNTEVSKCSFILMPLAIKYRSYFGILEKEKWTNKWKQASSLSHNTTSHTQHLYQISRSRQSFLYTLNTHERFLYYPESLETLSLEYRFLSIFLSPPTSLDGFQQNFKISSSAYARLMQH